MMQVELTDEELEHIEKVHRHGNDPKTNEVFDTILRRVNEVEDGEVVYEQICNHDNKRECTEEERKEYRGHGCHPETICDDCGTLWDYYGRKMWEISDE